MTNEHDEKTFAGIAYVLHLAGAMTGLLSIVGLVLNYLKRAPAGPVYGSHHDWMIRTFWWGLLWLVLSVPLILFFGLGWLLMGIAWIWYVYRHVLGLVRLLDARAMPG